MGGRLGGTNRPKSGELINLGGFIGDLRGLFSGRRSLAGFPGKVQTELRGHPNGVVQRRHLFSAVGRVGWKFEVGSEALGTANGKSDIGP